MPKYLMQVFLTKDDVKGRAKDGGTKRRQAAEQFFKSAGGKLEALCFAFDDTDVFAIVDFPIAIPRRAWVVPSKQFLSPFLFRFFLF
jgi:uncharacterized protein with GYD domain